jgi:endogenous inhibitor of DNA gyrase (YacG/DUF329 family)
VNRTRVAKCPTCGRAVEWVPENRYRPFCSERCKMLDLGTWASEGYRIPGPPAAPAIVDPEQHD